MKIELKQIKVRDLVAGYVDEGEDSDEAVVGYSGKLNIRPAYQRAFVYKEAQRNRVIETVRKGFPLNVMYWAISSDAEHPFEVLDGQQRAISICQYCRGDYSVEWGGKPQYFSGLTEDQQNAVLDYTLMVYFCEGTDSEKLEWFRTINIAGEKLTEQELRNAVYTGEWLSGVKRYFSKVNGPAVQLGGKYIKGDPKRQELLETVLDWISDDKIDEYMAKHQSDVVDRIEDVELVQYFEKVLSWVKTVFPVYRSIMKGLDWGVLYNAHRNDDLLWPSQLDALISKTLAYKDEVGRPAGVYRYVLGEGARHLNVRTFGDEEKNKAFERQRSAPEFISRLNGITLVTEHSICPECYGQFKLEEMEADHIIPWSKGGTTSADNCQMLCKKCNRNKSDD